MERRLFALLLSGALSWNLEDAGGMLRSERVPNLSRPEVYVASFSDPSEQWRVSSSGGRRPRWRGDGKELFFMGGPRLMAAAVALTPSFRVDEPRPLFSVKEWSDYAVAKDGQRFLISTNPSESAEATAVAVLNWTSALKE
jgi:hypothetical protein